MPYGGGLVDVAVPIAGKSNVAVAIVLCLGTEEAKTKAELH